MSAKSEAKKVAILAAVEQVSHDVGLAGVSIATVARAAGVPKSVVLYHFGSRETLLDAALARWLVPLQDRISGVLGAHHQGPRERLGGWFTAVFSARLTGWQLLLQLSLEPPHTAAAGRAAAWERALEDQLALLLRQGHRQLAWRAPRPQASATAIRCLVEGLVLTCARGGEPEAMAGAHAIARQTALDWLLRT